MSVKGRSKGEIISGKVGEKISYMLTETIIGTNNICEKKKRKKEDRAKKKKKEERVHQNNT